MMKVHVISGEAVVNKSISPAMKLPVPPLLFSLLLPSLFSLLFVIFLCDERV
jgi:hypothetical protein